MTDASGEAAYPIAATAFILMFKEPKNVARAKTAMEFFQWALENGQKQADDVHYVPLPTASLSGSKPTGTHSFPR